MAEFDGSVGSRMLQGQVVAGGALECLTCLGLMPASTACSPAQVLPESSHHSLAHSAFLVTAFMGLLLKVWCKMPLPDELVKSVSSKKLGSLFIVQCESVMIVFCMGKLSRDLR